MDVSILDTPVDEDTKAEINAFIKGKGKARTPNRNKKPLSCFNCGKMGHMAETTKLTQELAVRLEQGRDLRQWHSMAN